MRRSIHDLNLFPLSLHDDVRTATYYAAGAKAREGAIRGPPTKKPRARVAAKEGERRERERERERERREREREREGKQNPISDRKAGREELTSNKTTA